MNDVEVDERQGPILGDPACVWRKKKDCNYLTYRNDEAHSEFAGAVINPGTNTMKWPHLDRFIFNFRSSRSANLRAFVVCCFITKNKP